MFSLADRALALRLGATLDYAPHCEGSLTCECFWCETVGGLSMRERALLTRPAPERPTQPWVSRAA